MRYKIHCFVVALLLILLSLSCNMFIYHDSEEKFRKPAISYIKIFEHKDKVKEVRFVRTDEYGDYKLHEGNATYCEHVTREGATLNVQAFSVGGDIQYEINIISEDLNEIEANDFTSLFSGYEILAEVDFGGLPMDKVTSMKAMFSGCKSLEKVPDFFIGDSNGDPLPEVITMEEMFEGCELLTSFDSEKNFESCGFAKLQSCKNMFENCKNLKNIDIKAFEDAANARLQDVSGMFSGCENLDKIWASAGTDWSSNNRIKNFESMFQGCKKLEGYDENDKGKDKAKVGIGGYFTDRDLR